MKQYGPAGTLVLRLIERAGMLTIDEAADVYRGHVARILIQGSQSERLALLQARRVAANAGLRPEYEQARRAAATAWRRALPETQGPWLIVGAAIANAAGAVVVEDVLDDRPFQLLVGPWRQAIGILPPVGPGGRTAAGSPAIARRPVG